MTLSFPTSDSVVCGASKGAFGSVTQILPLFMSSAFLLGREAVASFVCDLLQAFASLVFGPYSNLLR